MNFKMIAAGIACSIATLPAFAQSSNEQVVASTEETPKASPYGKNIIAVSPIQMSENGAAGFGLSYEHILDKQGIISLYVPFSAVMSSNSESRVGVHKNDPMFYLMPGVKIYPTGAYGKVKYAIGPSIAFATGQRTDYDYNAIPMYNNYYYGPYYTPLVTRSHTMLGMVVNQSLNINPTAHLYMGIEFGLGFTYMNQLDGVNQGTTGLVQFGFKMGYRFQ